MDDYEKMAYYFRLEYEEADYLQRCQIEEKRYGRKPETSTAVEVKKAPQALDWEVTEHSAEGIKMMMQFQNPDEVSSTSLGRDRLIIVLKDIRVFKSQITGEYMDHRSFEGIP